mmetsp:Transcript_3569/g.8389  ORF Transcript_3569/g.8389 Transcript_3569/m.8389 type:complete len:200 (-) Transcript_3569:2501-3100(-)
MLLAELMIIALTNAACGCAYCVLDMFFTPKGNHPSTRYCLIIAAAPATRPAETEVPFFAFNDVSALYDPACSTLHPLRSSSSLLVGSAHWTWNSPSGPVLRGLPSLLALTTITPGATTSGLKRLVPMLLAGSSPFHLDTAGPCDENLARISCSYATHSPGLKVAGHWSPQALPLAKERVKVLEQHSAPSFRQQSINRHG